MHEEKMSAQKACFATGYLSARDDCHKGKEKEKNTYAARGGARKKYDVRSAHVRFLHPSRCPAVGRLHHTVSTGGNKIRRRSVSGCGKTAPHRTNRVGKVRPCTNQAQTPKRFAVAERIQRWTTYDWVCARTNQHRRLRGSLC